MGPTEWVLIAILSVLWGGIFLFVELALAALTLLVWMRVSPALPCRAPGSPSSSWACSTTPCPSA
jgi:hypothetical protein